MVKGGCVEWLWSKGTERETKGKPAMDVDSFLLSLPLANKGLILILGGREKRR